MGPLGRTLGGGVALACAASLSGGTALPALERALSPAPARAELTSASVPGDVPPELQSPSADVRVSVTEVDTEVGVEIIDSTGSVFGSGLGGGNPSLATGSTGIPAMVLRAYDAAAKRLATDDPGCGLRWQVLAGIGKIESGHARGGQLNTAGVTVPRIIGPVLNGGPGVAAISDSDGGAWDGDSVWDRAVGPMQFIPGTWRGFGADADGDGVADPHNMWDAALSAGKYLCAGGSNLKTSAGLQAALFRYNHSQAYVNKVLSWINAYLEGDPIPTPDRGPGSESTDPADEAAREPEKPKVPKPPDEPIGPDDPDPPDNGDDPDPEDPPDPGLVAVPEMVGLTLADAQAALTELGLVAVVIEQVTTDASLVGQVLAQDPGATTQVAAGGEVTLTVGVAPPEPDPVVVPDLVGMTRADAEAALAALGLVAVVIEQVTTDASLVGQVLAQDPGATTQVAIGAEVALTVGVAPPEPDPVIVPDLVGMTLADAEAALAALGLVADVIEQVVTDETLVGTVLSQDPDATTQVAPGTEVALAVGVAPQPVPMPELVGLTLAEAQEALAELGFDEDDVVVVEQPVVDDADIGRIVVQDPEATTEVVPGSEVTLTVGVIPA